MSQKYQPNYDKILSPTTDINTSIEALLEGAFGSLMGDQREGLKRIYASSWGLYTLLMDIITSLGIENIARRSYLDEKFDAVINPIIDLSKTLLDGIDGPLSEEQVVSVDFIYQMGKLLRRYVDNLRLYSRVLHKQVAMQIEAFVLNDALQSLRLPVMGDDIALDYVIADDLPPANGDENATRIAIQHMLQNAIESTKRGYIRVAASADKSTIRIEVEDSGIGIGSEHRKRVFEPFYQADKTKDGIGLGINIAHGLLQKQNGDLELRHSGQEGSIFVCTLPTL